VRLVVGVALTLAVVGAAMPLVEDAAATRAATAGQREADAVRAATLALAESDATTGPGARRVLEVRLPDGPVTGTVTLAVGGVPNRSVPGDGDRSDVVAYRVAGRPWRVAAHLPLDLRTGPDADDADPLLVRDDRRLVLSLRRRGGDPVVRATTRVFKRGNGTSRRHA
jgi:hypothetical protein